MWLGYSSGNEPWAKATKQTSWQQITDQRTKKRQRPRPRACNGSGSYQSRGKYSHIIMRGTRQAEGRQPRSRCAPTGVDQSHADRRPTGVSWSTAPRRPGGVSLVSLVWNSPRNQLAGHDTPLWRPSEPHDTPLPWHPPCATEQNTHIPENWLEINSQNAWMHEN